MAKIHFNVDAYTAKLIGRENVSKLDGAILELVKNTYDADASICLIYYEKSTDTLYIGDNGTGMTESIIKTHWMTIGSSSKKINFKSGKGRIQTGAKGIGRFALDRIADKCSLLTISREEHLIWNVDWNVFEYGHNITDITAELEQSELTFAEFMSPIVNAEVLRLVRMSFGSTGSFFKLTNLRDSWNKTTISNITSNLKTLIPPEFREVFNIYFFEEHTTLEDAALLQEGDDYDYDYRIKFSVFSQGEVRIEIHRNEFDFGTQFDKVTTEAGFNYEDKSYFRGEPIVYDTMYSDLLRSKSPIVNTIGDFEGVLYFAKISASKNDRQKFYYKDISGRPDIRTSFGGIRIYRDGFRVRPYGDPSSALFDWLMLSSRKNKSPAAVSHPHGAWRVNSDQIHGSIYISRTNIALADQSNRQGFVETREFHLLQVFLKNVIRYFERDRQAVCRQLDDYYKQTHPTYDIQKELEAKLKEQLKNKGRQNDWDELEPSYIEVEKASALLEEKDREIRQLETELKLLRVLATTGIVTNTYIHEIKNITHKLGMKITMAKESLELDNNLDDALKYVREANELRQFFTSWFKVTVDSVRRDKRTMRKTNINELISGLVSDWQRALKEQKISINSRITDLEFKCFPYEIESIFNNLIANSTTSFESSKVPDKQINIEIRPLDSGIIIEYSDNGGGLSGDYKRNPRLILESFESDKRSINGEIIGTGMGMWIVNRIVNEYDGAIDLSRNISEPSGFYITIFLKVKS